MIKILSILYVVCSLVNVYPQSMLPVVSDSVYSHSSGGISGNDKPYALVAGGSKGIGYAISEALAKRQYNLILIARHIDALQAAKDKLESAYGIHVEILVFDLSREESAGAIAKWCIDKNIPLKMLCNVAGLGGAEDY